MKATTAAVSVEERHRLAHAVVARAKASRPETLEEVVRRALAEVPHRCFDDAEDRRAVTLQIVREIRASTDARFVRDALGDDPADRLTRLHAHGAITSHLAECAWRLAGG